MLFKYCFSVTAILVLALMFSSGCRMGEGDKESYLTDYRLLMKDLETRCGRADIASDDDYWQDTDDKIYDFAGIRYWQYYEQLSFKERLEINKFPVMYYLCRYKSVVNERVQFEFQGEVETLVKGLTEIMDSTANIYKDYDAGIRDILHDFKSREDNR